MKIKSTKSSLGKWMGVGIFTAIAASLCCITPVLALIAGTSGIAATFSWMEPARPYLMAITILVLGFAWYQKLKPRKVDPECDCEEDQKPTFIQSKKFLGLVTVLAALMLSFPFYSHIFYSKTQEKPMVGNIQDSQKVLLGIKGMTCTACEDHVKHAILGLPGIIEANADFHSGIGIVKYDPAKISLEKVISTVNETGYKVIKHEEVKK